MALSNLYEPAGREGHASLSTEGKMYVWGGGTLGDPLEDKQFATNIEQFDPYLEVWSQSRPAMVGTPHLGQNSGACAPFGELMYVYGGYTGKNIHTGILSCLDLNTHTWSLLCPAGTAGGPMRKIGCGMVHFHHDKLAVIGGYGFPSGSTQPGSTFVRNIDFSDGRGWTNEVHIFDLSQGVWFSPTISGTRPPPCAYFTLISIDNHRAVLFGGIQPRRGQLNDLYLIDFDHVTMEITKVEQLDGEAWPAERIGHAACCFGHAGYHTHMLITGGRGRENQALKDMWLFDLLSKKWKWVSLPDVDYRLPRVYHSAVAITLYPGLVEIIEFGGRIEAVNISKRIIAETTVIMFNHVNLEWVLVDVANNSQRGTSERARKKMMKISEKARAAIDNKPLLSPQTNKRALSQERVETEVREERQRAQKLERRLLETTERAEAAEERSQYLDTALREERQRIQTLEGRHTEEIQAERRRANQRVRETEQQLATTQERERVANIRVWEAQQQAHQAQQRVEQIEQATEVQLHQVEERVQAAERRAQDLQQRTHEVEQRSHDLQQRVHAAEQHTVATERRLQEVEQRAGESERRARQAEALVQQNLQESHWLVQRREIELTEEERGRGGWAAVKVANFRGTSVAAKCFYQQILVSRYNRQLFNREMNMAARLRHPNLVQFIGASLEGEPIILTELMTTSLRTELEKGPIEHAHITSISLDVARALNYLHLMQPHPIIHRDISSANVLLDHIPCNQWKAKVSDYGSVNLLRELRTVGPGSPVYAAPEANIPVEQSPKMDVFSFGVLLIEMLTDEFPSEDARQRLLDSINHAGYLDLIRRCLKEDKEERPSANEIITNIQDM